MEEMAKRLEALRKEALCGRDPTSTDETLAALLSLAAGKRSILEIGAAECLTSIALRLATGAQVTAIELDRERAERARTNISAFRMEDGIHLIEGDAGDILPCLEEQFDLIFLDGPKAQYRRYFPDCKRLLAHGGVLVTDDVLLYGWVRGTPPKKRRMLIGHIREYLAVLESDPDFETEIREIGEGLAVSRKK